MSDLGWFCAIPKFIVPQTIKINSEILAMSKISQSDVIATIEKALELKTGSLGDGTPTPGIENWDSLGQLSILVALDKLFDGKLAEIQEMAQADSISKIMAVLKKHSLI